MPRSKAGAAANLLRATHRKVEAVDETGASALRDTGIGVIGNMPWETHICVFYQTKKDLLDTAVAYFEAGLRGNEFCVWAISDPITEADARQALRLARSNLDRHLARGHIELVPGRDWYLEGDQFDLKRITSGWNAKLHSALAKGYAGLRISGNAFWIATNHWTSFCEYEQELDRSLSDQHFDRYVHLFA